MRLILLLGLLSYWVSHPAAVHALLLVARSLGSALLHPAVSTGGATTGSVILMLGSHWH